MKKIDELELDKIDGGSASVGVVGTILLAFTTISVIAAGIFKGYTNPEGCNE